MVNEERVRVMTKTAIFEEGVGKKALPTGEYYRSDYLFIQMLKSFFWGSAAFGLIGLLVVCYGMDALMSKLPSLNVLQLCIAVLIAYVLFMVVYMGVSYVRSYRIYRSYEKAVKGYEKSLKHLENMYE
ncbi:MAG: hypothetical protein E7277_01295 [Lachnospiraceae bacterium]|jgi:ABC-type multidrug transport system fused ATPase/permease subunit|nr:hypothetical protein [Lachnospiraceae bacterium]